jgi:hypothetical protein
MTTSRRVLYELVRFTKALALLLLFIAASLLVCCGPLYFSHNRTAQHLLGVLNNVDLPPHTSTVDRQWDVGGYEGASTACEALAYIVIKSDEPRDDVLKFYNDRFPAIQKQEIDADCYVAPFDQLPPLTPSNIRDACAKISPDQRKTTYAVWMKQVVESQAWDVRGW